MHCLHSDWTIWLFGISEPRWPVSQYWSQKNISTVKLLLFPKACSEDRREIGHPSCSHAVFVFFAAFQGPQKMDGEKQALLFQSTSSSPFEPVKRKKQPKKWSKKGDVHPKHLRKWMMLTNFCPQGLNMAKKRFSVWSWMCHPVGLKWVETIILRK